MSVTILNHHEDICHILRKYEVPLNTTEDYRIVNDLLKVLHAVYTDTLSRMYEFYVLIPKDIVQLKPFHN